jgi:hypothetical protein
MNNIVDRIKTPHYNQNRIERSEIMYSLFTIEDESHLLTCCSLYNDFRLSILMISTLIVLDSKGQFWWFITESLLTLHLLRDNS